MELTRHAPLEQGTHHPQTFYGNPRVTSWWQRGDDALIVVDAPFELFGGPSGVNVGPVHGGPDGWLITGNRTTGPAVWAASNPRTFTLIDHAPGLQHGDGWTAIGQDAAWVGDRWVMVGVAAIRPTCTSGRRPSTSTSTSSDGLRWARERVPGSTGFDDLQRVVANADGAVAVGLRDDRFGSWRRTPAG